MICDPTSGTSKAGKEWTKQEFIVSLDGGGNYPDELVVAAFGDEKMAIVQHLTVGQHVELLIDTRAQEYNGRYFNSVSLYRIGGEAPQQQGNTPAPVTVDPVIDYNQPADDGLPF